MRLLIFFIFLVSCAGVPDSEIYRNGVTDVSNKCCCGGSYYGEEVRR